MATVRVAQITGAKGKFEIVERPIPEAAPGTVRLEVAACGVCHSDSLVKDGLWHKSLATSVFLPKRKSAAFAVGIQIWAAANSSGAAETTLYANP